MPPGTEWIPKTVAVAAVVAALLYSPPKDSTPASLGFTVTGTPTMGARIAVVLLLAGSLLGLYFGIVNRYEDWLLVAIGSPVLIWFYLFILLIDWPAAVRVLNLLFGVYLFALGVLIACSSIMALWLAGATGQLEAVHLSTSLRLNAATEPYRFWLLGVAGGGLTLFVVVALLRLCVISVWCRILVRRTP